MAEDISSWAAREGLSNDTVKVILDEDFSSVEDLKELSQDDIMEIFQKPLTGKNYVELKKAISRLSRGQIPGDQQTSQQATPSYSQGRGRDQPDSEPSGLEGLDLGSSADDPLGSTKPVPGRVKALLGMFNTPPVEGAAAGHAAAAAPKPSRGVLGGLKDYVFGSDESAPSEEFRFLMLGKTGSGKSTTGNTILGEEKFAQALRFSSVTSTCDLQRVKRNRLTIQIMDCPGLYDTEKSQESIANVIVQAVACMHPGPHAILLVIRLGRFTPEEFGVVNRLKALFDDRILDFMIVLFTGGDDLDREKMTLADLMQSAPKDLLQLAEDCGHRCHVFNNNAKNKKPQVDRLLEAVRKMKTAHTDQPHYICPKYAVIGKGLEEEVARRLAEVTTKDLEREQYIQQLEIQTREAKAEVEKMKAEIKDNEGKRHLLIKKESKRKRKVEEQLQQELEAKKTELDEEKRKLKEIELKEQLEKEKAEFMRRLEEEKREEIQRLKEKEEKKLRLENQKLREEREEQERREEAYREQMNRMKDGIANNEEEGWIDWAAKGVASTVAAPFKFVASWF